MTSIQNPPTPEELDELEALLAHADIVDKSMDVSMLHGFLTALVVGPDTVPVDSWLPWVWDCNEGEEGFKTATPAERERARQLVMAMHDDLAAVLRDDPESFDPLWETWENATPDNWCRGFLIAIGLNEDAWDEMLEAHPEWLDACMVLADEEEDPALDKMSDDELDAYYGDLFDQSRAAVLAIGEFWASRRGGQ